MIKKIPYTALKLKEAMYLMGQNEEGGYFDACGQVVMFEGMDKEGFA